MLSKSSLQTMLPIWLHFMLSRNLVINLDNNNSNDNKIFDLTSKLKNLNESSKLKINSMLSLSKIQNS